MPMKNNDSRVGLISILLGGCFLAISSCGSSVGQSSDDGVRRLAESNEDSGVCEQAGKNVGSSIDTVGREAIDSDHDRIADYVDKCPSVPEIYNGYLDLDGCPDVCPSGDCASRAMEYLFQKEVCFRWSTSEFIGRSEDVLEEIAEAMKENAIIDLVLLPGVSLASEGDEEKRSGLEKQRSHRMLSWLVNAGLKEERFYLNAYGDCNVIEIEAEKQTNSSVCVKLPILRVDDDLKWDNYCGEEL